MLTVTNRTLFNTRIWYIQNSNNKKEYIYIYIERERDTTAHKYLNSKSSKRIYYINLLGKEVLPTLKTNYYYQQNHKSTLFLFRTVPITTIPGNCSANVRLVLKIFTTQLAKLRIRNDTRWASSFGDRENME